MGKWITDHGSKEWTRWGRCEPALAAQICAAGGNVRLVEDGHHVDRVIMSLPRWAQPLAQRHPAIAMAHKVRNDAR